MTLDDFLQETKNEMPRRHVVCADGFRISIQYGEYLYCSEDTVELGFPSSADDLIQKYAETPERPTDTVYGWVPRRIVEVLLEKHGGIVRLIN